MFPQQYGGAMPPQPMPYRAPMPAAQQSPQWVSPAQGPGQGMAQGMDSRIPAPQVRMQSAEERLPAQPLAITETPRPAPAPEAAAPMPQATEVRPALLSTPLTVPPPEELGLRNASSAEPAVAPANVKPASRNVDWTAVHARIDRLGVTCFQVQSGENATTRVTGLFAVAEGRVRRIEATGTSASEAIDSFMAELDSWTAKK